MTSCRVCPDGAATSADIREFLRQVKASGRFSARRHHGAFCSGLSLYACNCLVSVCLPAFLSMSSRCIIVSSACLQRPNDSLHLPHPAIKTPVSHDFAMRLPRCHARMPLRCAGLSTRVKSMTIWLEHPARACSSVGQGFQHASRCTVCCRRSLLCLL